MTKIQSKSFSYHKYQILNVYLVEKKRWNILGIQYKWDSSGSRPSSQETQFNLSQTWSAGQSLPTAHVVGLGVGSGVGSVVGSGVVEPRWFWGIKVTFDGCW